MSDRGNSFAATRAAMIMTQIKERGINDTAVLNAMNTVPRELFVAEPYKEHAYKDGPLPIPANQTISQPYIVALMLSLLKLKPADRVLEIGAGSGYAAAVLSRIVKHVYAVERHEVLVNYARDCLDELDCANVSLRRGDGTLGWPQFAPYDAIMVSAGGPAIPAALRQQLAVGGRLTMPVGPARRKQHLVCLYRLGPDKFSEKAYGAVAFVPLIGAEGWPQTTGAKKSKRRP